MGFSEFVNLVLKLGITEIPVWAVVVLIAIVAVVALVAWRARGYVDDGQISALKAQLDAAKERFAVKDERLALAHDQQEELTRRLTIATETIAQLQKQISDGETWKAAQTIEAVRLAIQSATTANTALGSSLAGPAPVLFGPFEPPIHQGSRFTIYGPQLDKPEVTASSQSKGHWPPPHGR
jgi:hypothetical protein